MAIRWVSTPESIKANQPSVLAIVETLAAMGIAVWIAVTWETYVHIAIAAMIAPVLLLQTEESRIRAISYMVSYNRWFQRSGTFVLLLILVSAFIWSQSWNNPFAIVAWLSALIVVASLANAAGLPLVRLAGCLVALFTSPFRCLTAIPENVLEAVFVLDLKKLPHLLDTPRTAPIPDGGARWCVDVGEFIDSLRGSQQKDSHGLTQWWSNALLLMLLPAIIVPPFTYRFALKMMAITWIPLLWAISSTRLVSGRLQRPITIYRRDPVTKIVLWFSIFSLAGIIIKLVLHNEWAGFAEWWHEGPLREFLSLYVAPAEIPRWQLAIVINSAIAILMYIFAGRWLVRLEHGRLADETWPRRLFRTGLFIRPILSCYTIACMIYITIIAAWDLEWPALGEKWFPWQ